MPPSFLDLAGSGVLAAGLAVLLLQTLRDSERNAVTRFIDRFYSEWFEPTRFPLILGIVICGLVSLLAFVLLAVRLLGLAPGLFGSSG
jgi:hypothetical protein